MDSLFGPHERYEGKYRLVPDVYGTYTLEEYSTSSGMYLSVHPRVTPEEADKCIKHIEKDIIYYRDPP